MILHRSGPTENYAIFEANFEQSTDPKTQSLSVYDDDDYLALSAQTPTFSSNPKAAPLPTGVWLHLVFDMRPEATNGSSILSFRERDHPEAPLVERSRLTNLEFLVDQAPRRARLYLGLARYRLNTPALSIEYDNFLVAALP